MLGEMDAQSRALSEARRVSSTAYWASKTANERTALANKAVESRKRNADLRCQAIPMGSPPTRRSSKSFTNLDHKFSDVGVILHNGGSLRAIVLNR